MGKNNILIPVSGSFSEALKIAVIKVFNKTKIIKVTVF